LLRPDQVPLEEIMLKNPLTIQPNVGLAEGLEQMREQGADHFLVVDKDQNLLGFISAEKIRENLGSARTIGEIMVSEVVAINREFSVKKAVDLMVEKRINFMPVLDGECRLVGLITRASLVDVLAEKFWDRKDLDS